MEDTFTQLHRTPDECHQQAWELYEDVPICILKISFYYDAAFLGAFKSMGFVYVSIEMQSV